MGDPQQRELLAAQEPLYLWGVRRPCLEYDYYGQFNRENVECVNIKNSPIVGFTEKGIKLEDGTVYELDVICIATGFHITTGGMTSLGVKSINRILLKDEWENAAYTYLGTTISGYPDMFHPYGP